MNTRGPSSSSTTPPPSALLAPGFRFHPTDEELVSYYLRRKILRRPLRVDAIAEVDLYKCEPWDLPTRSRIRSRDVEWYFFSPLDRKHANKARTNRATPQGYWKTTGKDREVRRGSRVVGMKKTLVFHAGRAPRGERTNWVMHEYRIEGEELAQAGISQDSYVVCRIFQKSGSGPQNGAQYGAPFVEEEWDEEVDGLPLMVENGGEDEFNDAGENEFLQMNDFAENQKLDSQHEITPLSAPGLNVLDNTEHPEDPEISLDEILKDSSFINDITAYIDEPRDTSSPALNTQLEGNAANTHWSHSPSSQNNGYVELNDFSDYGNMDYFASDDSVAWPLRSDINNQKPVSGEDGRSDLQEPFNVEEFFDTTDGITYQNNYSLQPSVMLNNPPLASESYSREPTDYNTMFYDTPSDNLAMEKNDLFQLNELPNSPTAGSSGIDMLEDLAAYFDAADDNWNLDILDFVQKPEYVVGPHVAEGSSMTQEVEGDDGTNSDSKPKALQSYIIPGAPMLPQADKLTRENKDLNVASDIQKNELSNKSIGKRLASMLGSIPAPPAFAEEFPTAPGKSIGPISVDHSASSVHISAGVIEVNELTLARAAENWSLEKSEDGCFLLSCFMSCSTSRKSLCFDPRTKMHGGAIWTVLRGGFCFFLLSAVILSVSCAVGMCMYNKPGEL
uniref:NAC domain-containing protein n=1 Tax=Ananas comosus var. bracteatus TaxID=296719 RepID=A0A6V7NQU8_ANACO|nr:unnamed protein product [Ananas comosus var. bracteatus]